MNPMWLAYSPPEMLPTTTLNPTSSVSKRSLPTTGAQGTTKHGHPFAKRDVAHDQAGQQKSRTIVARDAEFQMMIKASQMFWIGVTMMSVGGLLVFVI